MKYSILIIIFTLIVVNNTSDAKSNSIFEIVEFKDLFKGIGVIFNKDFEIPFIIADLKERFTPTKEDVYESERILIANNNVINNNLYKYNRQYIGYFDNLNNKKIIIQLVDFSRPCRTIRLIGKSWYKNWVVYFSEVKKLIILNYEVNLSDKSIYQQGQSTKQSLIQTLK